MHVLGRVWIDTRTLARDCRTMSYAYRPKKKRSGPGDRKDVKTATAVTKAPVPKSSILTSLDIADYKGRLAYQPPEKDVLLYDRKAIHHGQKKLFLGEVVFLSEYGKLADTVLYIGAAPGIHLPLLMDWFPNHKFICYDALDFDVKENDRLTIKKQYFMDADAKEWAESKTKVLFVSDIRRDGRDLTAIDEDMDMQRKWVEKIKPEASCLKFRLPWKRGNTSYLSGKVYLQAFAPTRSTEARVMSTKKEIEGKSVTYDNIDYESLMYHFNCIERNHFDADNRLTQMILTKYNQLYNSNRSVQDLSKSLESFFTKRY